MLYTIYGETSHTFRPNIVQDWTHYNEVLLGTLVKTVLFTLSFNETKAETIFYDICGKESTKIKFMNF